MDLNWHPEPEESDTVTQLKDLRRLRRVEMGANIRRARDRAGWTQQQVADVLGYSRSHIHRVEQGITELGVTDLEVLAERFQVPIRLLIGTNTEEWDLLYKRY